MQYDTHITDIAISGIRNLAAGRDIIVVQIVNNPDTLRIAALCRRIDVALTRSRLAIDPARERAIQAARRMRSKGATLAQIARKFGVSTALASKWCRNIDSGPLPRGVEAVCAGLGKGRAPPPPSGRATVGTFGLR